MNRNRFFYISGLKMYENHTLSFLFTCFVFLCIYGIDITVELRDQSVVCPVYNNLWSKNEGTLFLITVREKDF